VISAALALGIIALLAWGVGSETSLADLRRGLLLGLSALLLAAAFSLLRRQASSSPSGQVYGAWTGQGQGGRLDLLLAAEEEGFTQLSIRRETRKEASRKTGAAR